MLWLHYLVLIALLTAVAAKYISPLLFWIPAFFGLAFPYLFLLNVLFIIYWMAQFKPVFTFGLLVLAISIPTAYRYVQISSRAETKKTKPLTVTSYNSMLFDLYNWSNNKQTRENILELLSETAPDILCLQEFYTSEEAGDFDNTAAVKKLMKSDYAHVAFTTTMRGHDHWGIATFSKYPIVNQGKIVFNTKSNNICIFSDIVLNKDTIRVYNVHLQSISFSRSDIKFFDDVMSEQDASDELVNGKNILRRLKRAFVKRTQQVDMIMTHIRSSPYKVILCGDFNDTASSYAYQQFYSVLEDAFVEKGFGFGRTYAGKWPQFRIDYIMHDPALHCSAYTRSQNTFTDHYPITASFDNINWHKQK